MQRQGIPISKKKKEKKRKHGERLVDARIVRPQESCA
jgi:hypothetical protein